MSVSVLERFQLDLAARLEADAFFVDIGIFVVRPRAELGFVQIQSRTDELLGCVQRKAGRGGASIQVLMPTLDAENSNTQGPLCEAQIIIRCQELPVHNMGSNGTGKSVEEIALNVVRLCNQFHRGQGNVVFGDANLITPSAEFDPKLTVDVRFKQKLALAGEGKTAAVTLSANQPAAPATVTLACITPGAAIVYSVDGSYPTLPYSAPFVQATAATIRAAAKAAGYQQANVSQLTLT